uniref:Pheromone B alpha 3 receptor n=1 Tax=Hypsizygus marmoreus TaxID=39966 RepID=A0A7G6E943_HYPMA|nr:pheromone B alpha 3 receptor [Hypsizygus marmoreus]
MAYPNYVYSLMAFIGLDTSTLRLTRVVNAAANSGTSLSMIWIALGCLFQFINSVIWKGNVNNSAPVWCDIVVKFVFGLNIAVPACSLCINRRLYYISHMKMGVITRDEKRRMVIFDLLLGVGLPVVLGMGMSYFAQYGRFTIIEDVGCSAFHYRSPLSIIFIVAPPMILGCATAIYSVLSIRAFYKSRDRVKRLLRESAGISTAKYIRLMCLSSIDLIFTIPISTWFLVELIPGIAWVPWSVHQANISKIYEIPASEWRADKYTEGLYEFNRWLIIICSFVTFAAFGLGTEAYRSLEDGQDEKLQAEVSQTIANLENSASPV